MLENRYLGCEIRTDVFMGNLKLLGEGESIYCDIMFKFVFPLENYKVESVLYDGHSALKVTKVQGYRENNKCHREEDPEPQRKGKGNGMYDEWREYGISPSDFI